MEPKTPNITLKVPESSIVPHIVLWVVQIIALTSPAVKGRRSISIILIIGLGIYCNLHPHFTNNFDLAQPFSLGWSFYTAVLAKLILSGSEGPEDHYWRVDQPAREARGYNAFSWQKLRWTLSLMFNHRGIRWNHQVKNVPAVSTTTKHRFIVGQLAKFAVCVCTADLLYEIHQRVNFTPTNGQVGWVDSKFLTMRHDDWRWYILKTYSLAALPYFALSMQFALVGAVAVLFGISKPQDWPSPFGGVGDMRTIRSFWGTFWHQQLRHMLTSFTDAFADALGIARGTNVSSYSKLFLAFFISGSFHALSQLNMPRPANITAEECSIGILKFFIWQACAITAEDFVQWLWRKTGWSTTSIRNIGYLWVFTSLLLSLPLAGDCVLKLRIGTGSFANLPLIKLAVTSLIPIPP
ncbi:hypothetical protein BU24DRAFT_423362 [Aaosphaeria arxii CBS 175.79]|uniref:Wax synthase domain-containing protein n=1 Tax=Aaosphaeria arxii CBS 175.79 TaxID=1450172 RepID=A0A6A5XNC7_9PLEO|nr:uncharacterized protein BU24DRAFT_423362 [Aaosphaeria arxii CBS 175.79]KAF2014406.1 hypothetical protein BU24DRAFT_423362 [Aaosphaeria arxii CBS 175.79]